LSANVKRSFISHREVSGLKNRPAVMGICGGKWLEKLAFVVFGGEGGCAWVVRVAVGC
jgi:hypothetical protein